ncbi:RidA family protein [Corynebacterium liangguodongii]|uniref:LysR family transcriptional regulator n=1 Tax=Corynebacterium liangguodongii TaxID=2079535 RepID=A0A2S0WBS6_9CORY|nr:RidA family protein [Corynebacterium liangguodongii]AWB83218.1 LysR family transcriptional regulator [Corynebacterium liangguodongii]PWB98685.1 RidA family protein [Corynebacterium liangguodongii]
MASTVSEKLAELGISLPEVAAPLAAYVPATRVGNQVWTSGQLPLVDATLPAAGKVGAEITEEQAYDLARTACLNALAAVDSVVGIDNVTRVVRVVGYVASAPGFTGQPQVVNGASELIGEIFGEDGAHVRSAVGVAVLPIDAPVEIELVVEAR